MKDAASWRRKLVESQTRRGSREAPWSVCARSRALRSVAPDVDLGSSGSATKGGDRADLPEGRVVEISFQLMDPSEWKLAACGGFFREENITVLEAHSILYAVRHAGSRYPPGRLLILSDNLALVLALCKGRSNISTIASSHASNLCVWFQVPVLSDLSRWMPSELNYSDKVKSFL